LQQPFVDSRWEVEHVGLAWRTEIFLPWFEIAGRIVLEVGLIAAKPIIANLAGAWPEIGDEDAGVIAALVADDFAAGQGIDPAEPGVFSQGAIDPASLQSRIVAGGQV
jgi:hypothetical protein